MSDRPLTVNEAAEFLSVNPWQVRNYIKKKLLKAYKMGNGHGEKHSSTEWRIWKDDLVAFVNRSGNVKNGE